MKVVQNFGDLKQQEDNISLEIAKKQAPAMPKKSMTLTHIGLFVGGLAVGYFVYKKFKK
jgi:hypothetical protein